MNRIAFLLDGFNLYHSVKQASHDLGLYGTGTRWLDMRSLCASYLYTLGKNAILSEVYYFSALATHLEARKPDVTLRHRKYIECLEDSGIVVELGRFKYKDVHCSRCHYDVPRYEEKETDVAISIKLLELCLLDQCDTAIVVTGDTDVAPAIRAVHRLCKNKQIGVAFPYKRHNAELKRLADLSFNITAQQYIRYQLPDPCILKNKRSITKPSHW